MPARFSPNEARVILRWFWRAQREGAAGSTEDYDLVIRIVRAAGLPSPVIAALKTERQREAAAEAWLREHPPRDGS